MEIVYEKKYPKIDAAEEYRKIVEIQNSETEIPQETPEELLRKIYKDVTYILIPEKVKYSELFIAIAIEVSEYYGIDTTITRHFDRIDVDYSFDCRGDMGELKRVFSLADDYAFFPGINNRDITISMTYYTHAVMRGDRLIKP